MPHICCMDKIMMENLMWSNKDIPKKKKELAVKAYQSLFLKGFLEDF